MLGRLINAEDILWLIRGHVLRRCWTGPKLPHAASDLLNRKFHFLETCWSPRKLPGPNQCQPAKLLGHENSEFAFPRLPSPDSRLLKKVSQSRRQHRSQLALHGFVDFAIGFIERGDDH